jgi:hypothetical protein
MLLWSATISSYIIGILPQDSGKLCPACREAGKAVFWMAGMNWVLPEFP